MSSGISVHKKIKEKIREVESQTKGLASQLYQVEQNINNLTVEREDCYVSLATHYLPELDAQAVQTTLREVRGKVEGVFREKQERRRTLERLMGENRNRNCGLEQEVDELTAQIEQLAGERDKTLSLISGDLQKNEEYFQGDEEAKKAEVRLQQYKRRVQEVEGEAKKKLPAFEKNKLFSYLLRVSYGTSQYQRNGLRRRLDSWVAEKVSFEENKKCYDFLKSMPEMMKQEVERRQEELDGVVAEMEKIESEVENQHGLSKIVAKAEKLMSQRQSLIGKDKAEDEQYAAYVKERKEIDSKKDPYHVQAVQQIKNFLKGEEISNLRARAKKIQGSEDDRVVDKIDGIDAKVRNLKDGAKDVKKERDDLSEKLDGLREVEKRFRSKDYEGSYSTFSSGFDIDSLLVGYMLGHMTSGDVNRKIDSSQHTKTPSYHSSSNYSSSHRSSVSDSSGGGFGNFGGFSSGGGISGGGGFSSGSGF